MIKINTKIFRGATSPYISSCSIVGFLKLNIAQMFKIYDYYTKLYDDNVLLIFPKHLIFYLTN